LDDKVLKALMEPTRFRLLSMMANRAYCVRVLALRSGLSESAVSQHLKVLREAGLVYGEKRGYYTHYAVDKPALAGVVAEFQALLEQRQQPCDDPYHGCPESEQLRCRASVPPEQRTKDERERG